jgi:hypothetical protein
MALLFLVARKDMIVYINPSHTHKHTRCCLFVTREVSTKPIPDREKEMNGTHTRKEKIYHLKIASTEVDGKGNGHFVCCTHLSRKGRLTVTQMINK